MTKPENLYKKDLSEYAARANPTLEASVILKAMADAFEEGVDAMDAAWRERIRHVLEEHEEFFKTGFFIESEHIEALLLKEEQNDA